ncbi:hypothetical protein QR680_006069 [Steinernema hermaphroditum]|uniref:Uncharacterized protein n=1 Tax=Steinernema hermaphroditum TaxID=289476 RepID=A0AA39HU94_9BILA|nr:hypothetical protein QR680_006069 [Steinernema hermaphroditum]
MNVLQSRRLPGLLVGIVDLVVLSVPLVRGVYVFVQLKVTNPVAAGWVISVSLLYVLHVICIVLILFGVLFNKPLWMIPKLILKSFTILLCCGFTFTIFYWILSESEHLEDLVLSVIHFQDYASPAKIRFIGIGVLIASIIVTLLQFWLMYILVESYSYVKEMRIRQKVDAMVQKQSSERRDVLGRKVEWRRFGDARRRCARNRVWRQRDDDDVLDTRGTVLTSTEPITKRN